MNRNIEKDPEGLGPDLVVTSQVDEHMGHAWEATETLVDNPVEMTRWAYCQNCETHFMERSQTLANWDFN